MGTAERDEGGVLRSIGTFTFLFSDIESSTRLLQSLGDDYERLLLEHRGLVRAAISAHGGEEVGTEGDSFFVVFRTPEDALRAAVAAQLSLTRHPWPEGAAIRVRMGLHSGQAQRVSGDFVGLAIHRAARVASAAHGGQIITSATTVSLLDGTLDGVGLEPLGAHLLKDFDDPEDLFQVSHPDLPVDFPPPRTQRASRTNLPAHATSFVGREEEVREVVELLDSTRLLTLVGAGGAGKTRLAQEAGACLLDASPADGVWWVELASITDPDLVPATVALALGVREGSAVGSIGAPASVAERLIEHLRAREALLILDNCEHLIDACAALTEEMLGACPAIRILATSREPLGVSGETTWRVPSLAVPDPDAPAELIAASDAVRLFYDRARAVRQDFRLDAEDVAAVAQICRRLDGIPLAIELAAARVRSLSSAQIAERLDDRFRLLTGGHRSAMPRQRTLEALVDWSYDLLSDVEQMLLRRLSVFAGGFVLEAAEAVCSGNGIDQVEVLDLLTSLVDKSLVVADRRSGEMRYRLLETIRQYAGVKLVAGGESETFRCRHLEYLADLAHEECLSVIQGPRQIEMLDRLEAEHDDLRAALGWAVAAPGMATAGLRLAAGLGFFWWVRGYFEEGAAWYERVLDRHDGSDSTARARCLAGLAWFGWLNHRDLSGFADEALLVARRSPEADDSGLAEALASWSWQLVRREPRVREEALEVTRRTGVRFLEGAILHSSGIDAAGAGEREEARRLYNEALAIAREIDSRAGIVRCLNTLASLSIEEGDQVAAQRMWEESLALSRQIGDRAGVWFSLWGLRQVADMAEDRERSGVLTEELLVLARAWGDATVLISTFNLLGYAHLGIGDLKEARAAFEEGLEVARRSASPRLIATLLHSRGELEEACGQMDAAERLFEEGLELLADADPMSLRSFYLTSLGRLARRRGDAARARSHLVDALRTEGPLRSLDARVSPALEGVGLLAAGDEVWEDAARLLGAAAASRPPDAYHAPLHVEEREAAMRRAREVLAERFDELYQEGEAMARDVAVRAALAVVGEEP